MGGCISYKTRMLHLLGTGKNLQQYHYYKTILQRVGIEHTVFLCFRKLAFFISVSVKIFKIMSC